MKADRFNQIFTSLKVTKREIALDLGVSHISVGQWMRGAARIPEDIEITMESMANSNCEKEDKLCDGCGKCMPW